MLPLLNDGGVRESIHEWAYHQHNHHHIAYAVLARQVTLPHIIIIFSRETHTLLMWIHLAPLKRAPIAQVSRPNELIISIVIILRTPCLHCKCLHYHISLSDIKLWKHTRLMWKHLTPLKRAPTVQLDRTTYPSVSRFETDLLVIGDFFHYCIQCVCISPMNVACIVLSSSA